MVNQKVTEVVLGLGSNLNDPLRQIRVAIEAIQQIPQTVMRQHSGFYQTAPLGAEDQPDYVNAVVHIETSLAAEDLLMHTQCIENQQGRQRGSVRWQSRTLDIDILLFGKQIIETPGLQVPHPGLMQRDFVLVPLAEIVPDWQLPNKLTVRQALSQCKIRGLMLLQETDV